MYTPVEKRAQQLATRAYDVKRIEAEAAE